MDGTTNTCLGNMGVHEVFKIAIQVEMNGAEFYKKAANLYDNVKVSEIFRQLCCWEREHVAVIEKMYDRIIQHAWDSGEYRPNKIEMPESILMVGLAVFGIHSNPADELSGRENCIEVLDMAVHKEKDAVIFFTGLKGFMDNPAEREHIDEVIKEEMQHISYLEHGIQQLIRAKTSDEFGDTDTDEPRRKCPQCGTFFCSDNMFNLHLKTQSSINVSSEVLT
ncbi:ferritin family protein [Planctomycetota bacterium]